MNTVLQKTADSAGSDELPLPPHILVVEDDGDVRQLMTTILSRAGYRVDSAKDGIAGWESLRTIGYDLLITDNNMPSVSGLELIKMARSEGLHLPVILASGMMPTDEINQQPWLQIDATLAKPFTPETLLSAVRNALQATHTAPTEIDFPLPAETVVHDLDTASTVKPMPPRN